jgi:hypothetical protein
VVSGGPATTASEPQLRNDVFVDSVNLRRQMKSCSRGQLILQPATSPQMGMDGVHTVTLTTASASWVSTMNSMITRATIDLGPLSAITNYVILCFPPGTVPGGLISVAFVNSWLSGFNNEWCRSPSAQLRNFGKLSQQVQSQFTFSFSHYLC